jgi:1,4-dihydroxy-2-naphthoyl-CoA hydrolase
MLLIPPLQVNEPTGGGRAYCIHTGERVMFSVQELNDLGVGHFPAHIGIVFTVATKEAIHAQLRVQPHLMAPNGFLHAGAVVTLADTSAGYGCRMWLAAGAKGFTTIELKSNHLSTAREGTLECVATPTHIGRTTHVWDAVVTHRETQKRIALFRCTQLVLY